MHTFCSALRNSVLVLLLVASLAGCTTSRIPKPASRLGPGVYQGTGFLVRPDGLVLTAYHVVAEGNRIKVRCQGYDLVPAKLGEHSRTMDLAVLHTGLTGTPYLPPADPRSVRPGDPVFSMGFPSASYLGTDPKYSNGAVSSLTGGGREATLMLISVPTQPGGSGSPLLTMDGAVVGVVTAGTSEEEFMRDSGALPQNLNWAVKMEYATPLYDPPSGPDSRAAARTPREVADRAARAVCIVVAGPWRDLPEGRCLRPDCPEKPRSLRQRRTCAMSEAPENQQAESATHAPFRLGCSGCGADIDAPDRYFTLGPVALVPHANQALISVRCLTCETDHELAIWTMDQQRFISEAGPEAFQAEDSQVVALLERYEQLVQEYRRDVDAQYEQREGWPAVDLSGLGVEIAIDRFFAPSMGALAAARGLRQAVAERPGAQPPGIVLLGQYKCVLSFDETPQASYPYALHLSVGNTVVPAHLPSYALHWLVSLFFTPGEVPLLLAQPGQTVPVIHYYLPAYEPDLNPC